MTFSVASAPALCAESCLVRTTSTRPLRSDKRPTVWDSCVGFASVNAPPVARTRFLCLASLGSLNRK